MLHVTPYLKLYNMTARELAKTIIDDVRSTVGTISTCGIGTNLYLSKIALDQLNMFDDISNQLRSRAIQETMLSIKAKYGKNAILKGVNYDPAATGRERNLQIGGHKSNG